MKIERTPSLLFQRRFRCRRRPRILRFLLFLLPDQTKPGALYEWYSVACEQALLFGRAKRVTRERASRPARSSRASTFHDIPQIESFLAG